MNQKSSLHQFAKSVPQVLMADREEFYYVRLFIGLAVAVAIILSTSLFAQQAKYGTALEARAMLERVIVAVKADKAKALEMFNKGEGGFKDRDLQPFCFNKGDGKIVASSFANLIGTDERALKDKTGKAFGEEVYKAAVDGKITEVSYMFPRPGETEPAQKISFVTGIGDLGCGVGYFKSIARPREPRPGSG